MPSESLNTRAGLRGFQAWLVRRRKAEGRGVVHARDTTIEIELRKKRLEVVLEVLHPIDDVGLKDSVGVGLVRVRGSNVRRDRKERHIVRARHRAIKIEFCERRVELDDALSKLIDQVVLIESALLNPVVRFHSDRSLYV